MHDELVSLLQDVVQSTYGERIVAEVTRPELLDHGYYSTNIAFGLAKKNKKSPLLVAEDIVAAIKSAIATLKDSKNNHPPITAHTNTLHALQDITVAAPGFINITLKLEAVISRIELLLTTKETDGSRQKVSLRKAQPQIDPQRVIVEFTDPNPFKELHIGHLYSNAVGESLSRLLESQGHSVRRVCYQGDVGMHVAKALWGMIHLLKEEETTIEAKAQLSLEERVEWMGKAYAIGAQTFEEHEAAKQEMLELNVLAFMAAQEVHKEKGWVASIDYTQLRKTAFFDASTVFNLYKQGRAWSLEYFESRYRRLGTHFEEYYFESMVGEMGARIVRDHIQHGIFEEHEGAIVFRGEKVGLHTRVFINQLGLPTYEAKELGLAPTKYADWPYDRSIIVTGKEIDEYFKVLLAALTQVQPDLAQKTVHVSHGMVRLPEGKMSSRTGNVKTADWLLETIEKKISNVIESSSTKYIDSDKKDIINKATVATIKYALLKVSLPSDITFDLDASVSLDGDSGPYLLYTYARAKSVLTKASQLGEFKTIESGGTLELEEKMLLRHIFYLTDIVQEAADNLSPSTIARYATDVAQYFNVFYAKHHILLDGEENKAVEQRRLFLTQAAAHTLQVSLGLLGIETVERM